MSKILDTLDSYNFYINDKSKKPIKIPYNVVKYDNIEDLKKDAIYDYILNTNVQVESEFIDNLLEDNIIPNAVVHLAVSKLSLFTGVLRPLKPIVSKYNFQLIQPSFLNEKILPEVSSMANYSIAKYITENKPVNKLFIFIDNRIYVEIMIVSFIKHIIQGEMYDYIIKTPNITENDSFLNKAIETITVNTFNCENGYLNFNVLNPENPVRYIINLKKFIFNIVEKINSINNK